jgi:hypothetical protein
MQKSGVCYSIEVDNVNREQWLEILKGFSDANIYQTWSYDAIRFGERAVSHLVLKKNGCIVAAAQARILKIPAVNVGVAYVRWGPLWKRFPERKEPEIFWEMIKSLKQEYAVRRGLLLRVVPNEVEGEDCGLGSVLQSEGFRWRKGLYRTLLLDLNPSLGVIRQNMSRNWRKHLNKAEKSSVRIKEGTSEGLYDSVRRLHGELVYRKAFVPGIDIGDYEAIQRDLPDELKMKIMICEFEGKPIAALVGSALGDTGIELIAATGDNGLQLGGSYLLRWRMIEWLKESGCMCYNLNGINPSRNPGGYQFKSGLCGKGGREVYFLGQFDICGNTFAWCTLKASEKLLSSYRKARAISGSLVRFGAKRLLG